MPKKKDKNARTEAGQYVLIPEIVPVPSTLERRAFVDGLFSELHDQLHRYMQLNKQLLEYQARMTIVERNLQLTRDHLNAVLGRTDEGVPEDWEKVLRKVRFVGARLGDACVEVLREKSSLSTQEMIAELNAGEFRFRTGSPLRELNAALLRQHRIKREGDRWIYKSPVSQKGEVQPQD